VTQVSDHGRDGSCRLLHLGVLLNQRARNKVLRTNSLIIWVLLASSRIKLALQAMRHQDRQAIGEVFVGLHRGVLLMLITFT